MAKPYLVFMSGSGEYENIFELVSPIKPYIRGVCALIHDADEFDAGAKYILGVNNELGAGNVIFGPYTGRHDLSRNRILAETGIQDSDYLVILDLLERVPVEFAQKFGDFFKWMEDSNYDVIRYHVKPYLVRYREDMFYIGTPHESLTANIQLNQIELASSSNFQDESKVRINIRPIKRANDRFHWCGHYVKYLLLPNSNQNLLGLEHHHEKYSFEYKEKIRKDLIKFLAHNKYPRTIEGVLEAMKKGRLKDLINGHKILNDYYRLKILGDESIVDSHSVEAWDNMIKV